MLLSKYFRSTCLLSEDLITMITTIMMTTTMQVANGKFSRFAVNKKTSSKGVHGHSHYPVSNRSIPEGKTPNDRQLCHNEQTDELVELKNRVEKQRPRINRGVSQSAWSFPAIVQLFIYGLFICGHFISGLSTKD